jgi:tetratricopeptide (TPR) repeat protein
MSVFAVRMAIADYRFRQETLPGVQAAIRLEPAAGYYAQLAAMLRESDPVASAAALDRAVALNPWDSPSWIELGLRAEAAGDLAGAERNLLRAANVDRQYLPAWSLANYYFRRGDSRNFWLWARQAAAMAYGDQSALFALCWKIAGDGAQIEQKLDIRTPGLQANYLAYLTNHDRLEYLPGAAARLLAWNRPADRPVLLAACDQLIAGGRASQAIQIWNQLARLREIPYSPLAPASGASLTDGDFTAPPMSQGFDWRLPNVGGVAASLGERSAGLRISFSGRQPENCDVLDQILPVIAGANYELRFLYRTNAIAPDTGLAWRLMDLYGSNLLVQGENLASDREREVRFSFRTPACAPLVRLTLTYRRALGTTRIEGFIVLRNLRLTRVGNPASETCKAG